MNDIKIFTTGGLNYDTQVHLLPREDWADAINMRLSASDEQMEMASTNVEGNTRVGNYSYAAGTNICIGAFSDEFRNVIIAFIYNSQNRDEIIEIDPVSGTITPILRNIVWTGGEDITGFESWIKIHSIDVLHRSDEEGDLIFWTEGNTRPRKINKKKAIAFGSPDGYPSPIIMAYTLVAKEPPPCPRLVYGSDFSRTVNNLRGRVFQAQIRFVYDDYEKSTWSGWAKFAVPDRPFDANVDSDPALNNLLFIQSFTGDQMVKYVEIAVRENIESVWGDAYLIATLDKEKDSISDLVYFAFPFYNDTNGVLQPPAVVNRVWDAVPTKAGCMALVNGNTLVYGDITEGLKFDGDLNVTLDVILSEFPMLPGANFMSWKYRGKYRLGIVYYDEFKRTDGVHTYFIDDDSNNDFEITIPAYISSTYASDSYNIFKPSLNLSIFHRPPIWAKTFRLVRTNCLTYTKFFYYMFYAANLGDATHFYFDLNAATNSVLYNGQKVIELDFAPGDRCRVIRRMATNVPPNFFTGFNVDADLEVIEVLKDPVIVNTAYTGTYLKVRKNNATTPIGDALFLCEIYSPLKTGNTEEFFYEFDDEYQILSPGDPNNMRHSGNIQNQSSNLSVPAVFNLPDGDIYLRPRERMEYKKPDEDFHVGLNNIPVEDPNFSDKYQSAVNGNGRASIVDDDIKEQRMPSFIRFGGAYVQDTFVNETNSFAADQFVDSCSRAFGAIKRLLVRDIQLRVFQELKCGWIPISQSVLQTTEGNAVVSQSDKLLNNIQYYEGDFGIGNAPCSLASKNFADYFHDTNRGVICRLSRDGLTPISITGKINRFAILEDVKYKSTVYQGDYPASADDIPGRAQIYGAFDTRTNTYISAYQEIAEYVIEQDPPSVERIVVNEPKTIAWDEVRNRFVTRYTFYPEWMSSLKNDLITFKNGIPYIHNDKANRCRFYGENHPWSLVLVFNDKFAVKKSFLAIDQLSNVAIPCPTITTSMPEPGTGSLQLSNLIAGDFMRLEEHFHAAFLRDINSPGGLINGDYLKGSYMKIDLRQEQAQGLIFLNSVAVRYNISQLNNQ